MFYSSVAILFLVVVVYFANLPRGSKALEDGDIYKITSLADGNVITASTDFQESSTSASNGIIIQPWNNLPNQKWLAVEAVVAGDSYLLLSQKQVWNWAKFIARGERGSKDRHGELPDWTVVVGLDVSSGAIKQQLRDSKKYQQWKSVDLEKGKALIKSNENNKCLRNVGVQQQLSVTTKTPTTTMSSFFQSAKKKFESLFTDINDGTNTNSTFIVTPTSTSSSSISTSSYPKLDLQECDQHNAKQLWIMEVGATQCLKEKKYYKN